MVKFPPGLIKLISEAVKANPIRLKDIPVLALAGIAQETSGGPENDRKRNSRMFRSKI